MEVTFSVKEEKVEEEAKEEVPEIEQDDNEAPPRTWPGTGTSMVIMDEIRQDREKLHRLLDDQEGDDPRIATFLKEYDIHYLMLQSVRTNKNRLAKRVRMLKAQLAVSNCRQRVLDDTYSSVDDRIMNAKREVNEVFHELCEAQELEDQNLQEKNQLVQDIKTLGDKYFHESMCMPKEQLELQKEWTEKRDRLAKERDEVVAEVERLREAIHEGNQRLLHLEKARLETEDRTDEIKVEIEKGRQVASIETGKRDGIERLYKGALGQVAERQADIEELKKRVEKTKEQFAFLQNITRHQVVATERVKMEIQGMQNKIRNMQYAVEQQISQVQEIEQIVKDLTADHDFTTKELHAAHQQIEHLNKLCVTIRKKIDNADRKKAEILRKKDRQKKLCVKLNAEIECVKKKNEAAVMAQTRLLKERDNLRKELLRETAIMQKEKQLYVLHNLANKRIHQDNDLLRYHGDDKRAFARRMINECNMYQVQVQCVSTKIIQTAEDERRATDQVFVMVRHIASEEMKLLETLNLYEATRSEHAICVRTILNLKTLLWQQKERVHVMSYETAKLVQERDYRDELLLKEQLAMQRVSRQIMLLKEQLADKKSSNARLKVIVENQDADEKKLIRIKRIADKEYKREYNGLQRVIIDCENLNMALIKRHYDLHELYELSKLKQSLLYKGENMYRTRMREKGLLEANLSQTRGLRKVDQKYRDVVEELGLDVKFLRELWNYTSNRSKGLVDELSHPRTIHRWRNLLARDPAGYESLRHVHKLRRQLLEMDAKIESTTRQIHECDSEYMTYIIIVLAQPSPETVLQLKRYRHALTLYYENIKTLTADLSMARADKKDFTARCYIIRSKFLRMRKTWLETQKRAKRKQDQARMIRPTVFRVDSVQSSFTCHHTAPVDRMEPMPRPVPSSLGQNIFTTPKTSGVTLRVATSEPTATERVPASGPSVTETVSTLDRSATETVATPDQSFTTQFSSAGRITTPTISTSSIVTSPLRPTSSAQSQLPPPSPSPPQE